MNTLIPEISVCIITFNHELYITEAINSILDQKISVPYEILIGDDCSTDNTRKLCSLLADKFPSVITLLPEENKLGITGNLYRTLRSCRGRYIAVCDGDDYWTDDRKLSKQYLFLEKNPDYGLVYTDVAVKITTTAELCEPRYFSGEVFDKLLDGNFINALTVLFRKELIAISEMNSARLSYAFDHFYWLRIAASSKIYFMPEQCACYRIHGSNYSLTERNYSRDERMKMYPEFLLDAIHYYLDQNDRAIRIRVRKMTIIRKYTYAFLKSRKNHKEFRYLRLMLKIFFHRGLPDYHYIKSDQFKLTSL